MILSIAIAFIGAVIGSFLNVVIYRYPIMLKQQWSAECNSSAHAHPTSSFNICFPRSHCPLCKTIIPFYYNIPLFGYVLLKGKCHACQEQISSRYFLVEGLTVILSLIVFWQFGISLQTPLLLILTWTLIALVFIDIDHLMLPDFLNLSLLWLGLIASIWQLFITPTDAIIGSLFGYLFLWIIAKGYAFFRGKEGMGYGDCKMLAMFGAWLGPTFVLPSILLASLLALAVSVYCLCKKSMAVQDPIPFGPFIAFSGWVFIVFNKPLSILMERVLG